MNVEFRVIFFGLRFGNAISRLHKHMYFIFSQKRLLNLALFFF